jgi:hypothetical protein
MDKPGNSRWTQPQWIEEAQLWISQKMMRDRVQITGPIEQPHIRPWSTVMKIPTNFGSYYFKAVQPSLIHEIPITLYLSRRFPHLLPEILSADEEQGWMLMSEGGERLRELLISEEDLHYWEEILPRYALMQIELSSQWKLFLDMGVPDRSLSALPREYKGLIARQEAFYLGRRSGRTADEYRKLIDAQRPVEIMCERLVTCRLPQSLNHGDFHDANIFLEGGRPIFFDWGDSSISHPFFSMRTVFVSIENRLGLSAESPKMKGLLHDYLTSWEQRETRANLEEAFDQAKRLAPLVSALSWDRALEGVGLRDREKYAGAIPRLLQEFLALVDI